MNEKYRYVGVFFDYADFVDKVGHIGAEHLYRVIQNPHITFEYKPVQIDESLFGEEVVVKITGYGNDGDNEGVKVELVSSSEAIKKAFDKIEVPHITISTSENGQSVNTKNLKFQPVKPVMIAGIYRGHKEEGR